jgi:hypothetical protein
MAHHLRLSVTVAVIAKMAAGGISSKWLKISHDDAGTLKPAV